MNLKQKKQQKYQILFNATLRLLNRKPKTQKEIERYLSKKLTRQSQKEKQEITTKIIIKLKKLNYINDDNYIRLWVEDRCYFKPRSKKLLSIELLRKGINKQTIENYFDDNNIDEWQLAMKALIKKFKSKQKNDSNKMLNFLLRRGFNYHVSKKTIEEFTKKE